MLSAESLLRTKTRIDAFEESKIAPEGAVSAKRQIDPVLRYGDPVREFADTAVWVRHIDQRPVVICKMERIGVSGQEAARLEHEMQ